MLDHAEIAAIVPDLKTDGAIATLGDVRAAWLRDPDGHGNIVAIESARGR